jgi:hypothetical protein
LPPSIPNSHSVESDFQRVLKRLGTVRKRINASAAKEMKADHYDLAQKWMEMGRSLADFAERLEAFVAEWRRLVKATRIVASVHGGKETNKLAAITTAKRTPVWKYCEPALRALTARGGSASLSELLDDLSRDFASTLTEFDRSTSSSRGVPRWHQAIRQAYRHCQREGWIEGRRDGIWKITSKGAAVAAEKEKHQDA